MIVDHITNHAKYMHLPPRIVQAIQYIGSTDFTFVESGQYELDGKKLVSMVQRYKTKLPELKLEIMSRVFTVSKPFFQPYHFSNKTNNKKAGMAINKILP